MDIQIDNLVKQYGKQRAVDGISFRVRSGEVLGFLGPNGAGKTTTMKIITGYMAPSSGDALIGQHSVTREQDLAKRYIGYLPENNPLYLDMPVLDYLAFAAAIQGVPKANIRARIKEMVKRTGLDAEKHKKIGELSKGYRQRVGLAQAMIHDPAILILDEPTTGLDPNQIVEIRALIKELGKEKTVIFSTHILSEVEATCDRVLIINQGKIVADGAPAELRRQTGNAEVTRLRIEDAAPESVYAALRALPGIALVEWGGQGNQFQVESEKGQPSRRNIFQLCVQNQWTLTELTPIERDLEDVFRYLTAQ